MTLSLVTAPISEPVSLLEAKDHIRVSNSLEDDGISAMISTARQYIEGSYNVIMVDQTWRSYHNTFNDIVLQLIPLSSVVSVKYIDTLGAEQILSTTVYDVDLVSIKGTVELAYDQSWPSIRNIKNAVTVEFIVGYGEPKDVPDPLKYAVLLLVGYLYENREHTTEINLTELPLTFSHLMLPYRPIKI